MRLPALRCYLRCRWSVSTTLRALICLGLLVSLTACQAGGDRSDFASAPTSQEPPPQLTQHAVRNLLELYREAVLQEDIDRLEELLVPSGAIVTGTSPHAVPAALQTASPATFRDAMSLMFQQQNIVALELHDVAIQGTPPHLSVQFQEILSRIAPDSTVQHTQSQRTRLTLTTHAENAETFSVRIAAVHHDGPQVHIRTPWQIVTGVATRLEVTATTGLPTEVTMEVPETGVVHTLVADGARFQGVFLPPDASQPQPLQIRLRDQDGTVSSLSHHYRVRLPGDGVVQHIPETESTRLFAVAVAPDGTIWAGGEQRATLYQVTPETSINTVTTKRFLTEANDPAGRIEDIVVDRLGRLHLLVLAAGAADTAFRAVNQDIVWDGTGYCSTANMFDPAQRYPFFVTRQGDRQRSPSTRLLATTDGDVWWLGSDGGVARVADTFRDGRCPAQVEVTYGPIFRREQDGLPANTVPALVERADGSLWFGTVLGLARFHHGQMTPLPFRRDRVLQGKATTLEAFFQEVATAIFQARPLASVALGQVSFLEEFGAPVSKEDLVFSAIEDQHGRLWVGTLGGGLRQFRGETEASPCTQTPGTTQPCTRQDGFGSNIILALAVAPDGSLWAATPKGVSHLREVDGRVRIRTFSTLDGLTPPVRDVAVAPDGTVWLATEAGLARLHTHTGRLTGRVHDHQGRPLGGIEILVQGTRLHTVTDHAGQFMLANVPVGRQSLRVEGSVVPGGPSIGVVQAVDVTGGNQQLPPVELVSLDPSAATRLVLLDGDGQSGGVGEFLARPLVMQAQDNAGRGIPNVAVTLGVTQAPPVVSSFSPDAPVVTPTAGSTDATGQIQATLRLGTTAGPTRVAAHVLGLAAVEVNAVGIAGAVQRLVRVSGNNQSGRPGETFPLPLVVRLEDQFGNPVAQQRLTAQIQRGPQDAAIAAGTVPGPIPGNAQQAETETNARGEASFLLRAGATEQDIVVQVTAQAVAPVQFLAILGAIDTPDLPRDLAVTQVSAQETFAYIADRFSGLRVIDVSRPEDPQEMPVVNLEGNEIKLTVAGQQLFVATAAPRRIYVLDITLPRTPLQQGYVDLPSDVASHDITGIAVHDGFAYVVTNARASNTGTLQIIDVRSPATPTVAFSQALPTGAPEDIAVTGSVAYVPAGLGGLFVFDITTPTAPLLVSTLRDPNPTDDLERGAFFSSLAMAGNFAYVLEAQVHRQTKHVEDLFVVLDLTNRLVPQRRGESRVRRLGGVAGIRNLAVAGDFGYVIRGAFGLQAMALHSPDAPRFLGTVDTPSQALSIVTTDSFLYVTDLLFGLQVIQGPARSNLQDTDDDGVIDFFDAFPHNPSESLDTDRDGVGDNADLDDDNDGFLDEEESQTDPRLADPHDPRLFPLSLPPPTATMIVVDATCPLALVDGKCPIGARERNGTPEAPYQSISAGLRVVQSGDRPQVDTVLIRPGTYTPLTTQEIFPLLIGPSPGTRLTLRSVDPIDHNVVRRTVLDAAFTGPVVTPRPTKQITVEGLTLTHGAFGILADVTTHFVLRHNRIVNNSFDGVVLGVNSVAGNLIAENLIAENGQTGIVLMNDSAATISQNIIANNTGHGIVINHSRADITTNTIRHNGAEGIIVGVGHATIDDNTITDNGGIGLFMKDRETPQPPTNLVRRNRILRNHNHGIAVEGAVAIIGDNNMIHDNINIGIFAILGARVQITENTITGNTLDGIQLRQATATTISGNTIRRNHNLGIGIDQNSLVELLHANVITSNTTGVLIQQSLATCTANTIRWNFRSGVEIVQSSALLVENTINDNAAVGIGIVAGIGPQGVPWLSNNTVRHNGSSGIQIGLPGLPLSRSAAVIEGGIIANNGTVPPSVGHGIALFAGSAAQIGLQGERLTLADNSGAGIFVANDGSLADIDSLRITFRNNSGGKTIGAIRDVRDPDRDGLSNAEEALHGTDPQNADTDNDGLLDGFEVHYRFNPLDASDGTTDPDGDGLHNGREQELGTDPRNPDTDGDGLTDGVEVVIYGTFPLQADTDHDGLTDGHEVNRIRTSPIHYDTDSDGLNDGAEVALHSDPLDADSTPFTVYTLPVGVSPIALVAGDFNGDAKGDLVVANATSRTLSVVLGDGTGSFPSTQALSVPFVPAALAVADFDGNGVLDLVVANASSTPHEVALLLGDGQGGFTMAHAFPIGATPSALVVADFNRDALPDLAVANRTSNDVSILLADGQGQFTLTEPFLVGQGPIALAVGDLNSDSVQDLVVVSQDDNAITIVSGDGTGEFTRIGFFQVSRVPSSKAVIVQDIDGNQTQDLVVANAGENTITLVLGNGAGRFLPGGSVAVGRAPSALAGSDLNQDGTVDLVVANAIDNTVSILLGRAPSGFIPAGTFGVGRTPGALVMSDFNGDRKPDIGVVNTAEDTISILLSR